MNKNKRINNGKLLVFSINRVEINPLIHGRGADLPPNALQAKNL
jgi:hypothetical protein